MLRHSAEFFSITWSIVGWSPATARIWDSSPRICRTHIAQPASVTNNFCVPVVLSMISLDSACWRATGTLNFNGVSSYFRQRTKSNGCNNDLWLPSPTKPMDDVTFDTKPTRFCFKVV